MLNIQPALDNRLWLAIERSYQSGDFTAAIQDSIHFIGQLIRDRSGLDGDGAALVGAAFGGATPKLKVNNLQTESEQNVQRGIEQMLRGLYLGIRNPRSHEKHRDSSEDAESIILFINFLVRIINRSKSPFEMASYLDRVFDPGFSENARYAELMVAEVPERKRWDTLIAVFQSMEERPLHHKKLRCFFTALLGVLPEEQIISFCEVVSAELKTTQSEALVLRILQTLPDHLWPRYEEVARIRTETRVIASIKDGRHDRDTSRCRSGVLGTWAAGLEGHFVLKSELQSAIIQKLRSKSRGEQDYVLEYFVSRLPEFLPAPQPLLLYHLKAGLESGDPRYHTSLYFLQIAEEDSVWKKRLGAVFDNFAEKPVEETAEGVGDDDIPF